MEFTDTQEVRIREYFLISVLLKGAISLAEVFVGALILFIPISFFTDLVIHLTETILAGHGDFIVRELVYVAEELSLAGSTFIAIYLLSRGLIKVLLIAALLKNQLWAYPLSLVVLAGFVSYQLYQIAASFSLFIIALTLFDLVVMWFIWREYQVLTSHVPVSEVA